MASSLPFLCLKVSAVGVTEIEVTGKRETPEDEDGEEMVHIGEDESNGFLERGPARQRSPAATAVFCRGRDPLPRASQAAQAAMR